jgi:GDP-L-fucose synthase
VGTGKDLTIRELAEAVRALVGFRGDIDWDLEKPDGPPRKLLDVTRMNSMGWRPRIGLEGGIAETYRWYQAQSI